MTTIYADQLGISIVVGQKYFIEMYWIDEKFRVCIRNQPCMLLGSRE